MSPDLLGPGARTGSNGAHNRMLALHESTVSWTCVKRDRTSVPFDPEKIKSAVGRCFASPDVALVDPLLAESVVTGVINYLRSRRQFDPRGTTFEVEEIQQAVIVQLWTHDLAGAAEHYTRYREERRKAREERVDPAMTALFAAGMAAFQGKNAHLQRFQALDKFARFQHDLGRRETWPESVERTMGYFQRHMQANYPDAINQATWDELKGSLLKLEASPSMRAVQMAGPALERCQVGVYNCAYVDMDGPRSMAEDLYCLMQGTGVGFGVEYPYAIDKWPRIRKQRPGKAHTITIPDHTEGWCDTLDESLGIWIDGGDVKHDASQVRPQGTILRTKGGRASGPQPLLDLLAFARQTLLARQGDRLTSLDVHDMTCFLHQVGQMGGVRRASGISFSELDDLLLRHAKPGGFWNAQPWRGQANNSAVYTEKPSPIEFMEEWLSLAKSGTGERGIFNAGSLYRQLPRRRKKVRMRANPCGEIYLRPKQFCNLSIAVLRPHTPWEEVRRRVRLATIWGTMQATMTRFRYLSEDWKRNCEEERLLGVDLLGHLDHELLRPGRPGREQLLKQLLGDCSETNVTLSQRLGINPSAGLTCGKPSGDSSAFFNTAAGFKPHHGRHYIRRVRIEPTNPLVHVLQAAGVPHHRDYNNTGLTVFEFPCEAPEGGVLLGEQTAIEQLENWLLYKEHWTEHNPSVSIYVRDEEWLEVGHWVYAHWDSVGGLSFFPYDGGHYPLAPYETISEEEYRQRSDAFPEIDWALITRFEREDTTTLGQQIACTGGACAL